MFNEKFWLAVAFFTFCAFIIKYVGPIITKMLDNKSKQIAEDILAAKELKEKASQLLAKAEKYYQESVQYTQKLVQDAEDEAQKFTAESKQIIESEVSKKTAAALERIKLEEASALRQIKTKIVEAAIQNLENSLDKNMDKKDHAHLLATATQDFEKIIH